MSDPTHWSPMSPGRTLGLNGVALCTILNRVAQLRACLMKLARQKRSAIMCAEAVPWRCHRSLIADALTVRGVQVEDILSNKRSQVHSLISFAHVHGHRITY